MATSGLHLSVSSLSSLLAFFVFLQSSFPFLHALWTSRIAFQSCLCFQDSDERALDGERKMDRAKAMSDVVGESREYGGGKNG